MSDPTHYITQSVTNPKFDDLYYGEVVNLSQLGLTDEEIEIMEKNNLAIKLSDMPPVETPTEAPAEAPTDPL
jgi:hypothetical protein